MFRVENPVFFTPVRALHQFACNKSCRNSLRQKKRLSSDMKARPMFRNTLRKIAKLATGLATTAAGLISIAGEKDLYSDVQTGSVFTAVESPKTADTTETPRIARRITSLEQLAQLVRDASFESRTAEGRSVTTSKTLEPWLFPLTVTLSDDEQTLQICVALGTVTDKQKIDTGKLLSLLEANKVQTSARFGFNTARSRTELLGQIRNDGVTAELLRDEINRLTSIAKESESLWQIESARTQPRTDSATTVPDAAVRLEAIPQAVAPSNSVTSAAAGDAGTTLPAGTTTPTSTATNPASPAVTSAGSPSTTNTTALQSSAFTGRWSASRASNEVFAILFDANGSFVLVSIKDGKQAKSSGKFIVVGSQLTLEGTDGVRLSGTVEMKSATEFSFQPTSTTGTIAAFNFRKSL